MPARARRASVDKLLTMLKLGGVDVLAAVSTPCGFKVAVSEVRVPGSATVYSCKGEPDL